MAASDKKTAKERSRVKLADGRVVIVTAGDPIPDGAEVVEEVRSTVSEETVRSADVKEPSSGKAPSRKRKPKA